MTTIGSDVALLNLLDPDFRLDSPHVRAAAAANWYARTPTGIVVLRYHQCAALMRDRRLRRGMSSTLARWGVESGPFAQWMRGFLLDLEGETHHRLRKLVSSAFQQRRIAALEPFMRAKTHELVDRLTGDASAGSGRCEFMTGFADPYPAWVIAHMLGIPDREFDRFLGLANDLGLGFNPAAAQNLTRIDAALTGVYAYCDELIARRRAEPTDDLVSGLVAAEADGDRLSDQDLRSLITGLVFAGQDTTRNQLGLALELFAAHPEQWTLLATQPELTASAVEEVMRVRPTVTSVGRWSRAAHLRRRRALLPRRLVGPRRNARRPADTRRTTARSRPRRPGDPSARDRPHRPDHSPAALQHCLCMTARERLVISTAPVTEGSARRTGRRTPPQGRTRP